MTRTEILEKLITFKYSSEEIDFLLSLKWDSEELIKFRGKNLSNALKMYINEKVSSQRIHEWAELIENREDIEFENEFVQEVIFELANPAINGSLSKGRALKILEQLV